MSVLPGPDASPYLAGVADRLARVTVEIGSARGGGAGVVWAPDLVVTNAHVARAASLRIGLPDGRAVEADIVAIDRRDDLALLRMSRTRARPADLADSDGLRVGALVVALGHPLGIPRALTAGVVHALGPEYRGGSPGGPPTPPGSPDGRRWIHADLRLAPGNSGGPLADTAGRVVGINTMIAGGLALAIPINDVRRFVASALPRVT